MNQNYITPKIEELRRTQRIVKRQIESRTAELEKVNESLRDEITRFKRMQEELDIRVQERTAELARANESLLAEAARRAQAEETLRESEERYRFMADATPVLVWQSGSDRLCTYFNNGWLEYTGRTMEQELGNGWAEGVHPDDLRRCLDIYISAFERREPFVMEYRLRHCSGEYRWIMDRGAPLYSSGGSFLGYIGGCIDIHDRKLAEEGLRNREEQLCHALEFNQAIMANMAEGLYTLDSRGLVTYINPAAERLFGWRSAELLGCKMHDMTHYQHPDGRPFPAEECAGLQVLQKRTALSDYEDIFIRKDGTFFPVVYSSSPINSDAGIVGLVVVFRDMTAQKQAEEALHRSREELRALAGRLQAVREEERTALAREIHDELSGALTALKMDLSSLASRMPPEDAAAIEKTEAMARLIDATVNSVRNIVTQLRPGVLDDLGLIAAIEWQAEEFQSRSGIQCHLDLEPEEVGLEGDRSTAIFRIFQEALTNVARHAKASRIWISLKEHAGTLIFEIRDNGRGISQQEISSSGSLGLLGMRERALAFGGEIVISGTPERGTTVTLKMPVNPV